MVPPGTKRLRREKNKNLWQAGTSAGLPGQEELPLVQRVEKLSVAIRLPEFIEEQVHGFIDGKRIQDFAQDPDLVQIGAFDQEFLLARSGAIDIDGGEYALVDQLPVQDDLHVAGPLELLEDYVVHSASGIDQSRCHDGKAPSLLDLSRGAKEPFGFFQRIRVHAAREDLPAGW